MLRKLLVAQDALNSLNKLLGTLAIQSKCRQIKTQPTAVDADNVPKPPTYAQLTKYNSAETTKILEALNNKSAQELQCYDISKTRALKLHTWKTRNGPFKALQDVLFVEGFGVKVLEKFYKSLLQEPTASQIKPVKPTRTAPFVIPTLENEQQQAIRSSVAVRIGVASVTWARISIAEHGINAPSELTDWQHHDILDKKLHLNDLVQRCIYIDHLIPAADCYLFENPQMAQMNSNPGSVDQQNINIQKAQIQAMLSYALAARARTNAEQSMSPALTVEQASEARPKAQSARSNVYYLRRFLAARLFNHLVGTERVSSEDAVRNLMRTHYNLDPDDSTADTKDSNLDLRGNVQFPANLRHMFANAERFQREFLGQALLLNLAFLRLVLLQDPHSISVVARNTNKDKPDALLP